MADQRFESGVVRDLVDETTAIGELAKSEEAFRAAIAAFQSADRPAFQAVLEKLQLTVHCRLICEWIRSKQCVLLCLRLCGLPKPTDQPPDPRALAEAIARLDEKAIREVAAIVEKGDAAAFQHFIAAYKLGPFCHLFCHWVCYVRYHLVCRWVCNLDLKEPPNFATELLSAAHAVRGLLEHKTAFNDAVAASTAGDATKLAGVIEAAALAPFCFYICLFFCSWRCVLVCLRLCRQFPFVEIPDPLKETLDFAQALQPLAANRAALEKLSLAVGAQDEKTFAAIVTELKLQRYCIQLCHWICFVRCRRFCIRVCPPIFNHPWFTHVGDFDILGDFDPGTGLTNKAHGHGGPNYGFFGGLSLRGFCPKYSPAFPGAPMAYRFLFVQGGGTTNITGGFVSEVLVGSRYTLWNANPFALQSVRIRGTGVTSPTPPPPSASPTPPDHFIVPDPQGWVTVDPQAIDDGFNGGLMGLASHVAVPVGNPVPPGLAAGSPVTGPDQKNGVDAAIVFQATRVSTIAAVNGGAAPDYTNQLAKIRINNWGEVMLLDILQFHSGSGTPCSPLSTDLDIEYTTDHELMAAWSIEMITAATIVPAPTFPSGVGPRGGAGTDHHDISTWPTCSYAIRLHSRRSLTDGLVDDSDKFIEKTFCIGRRNGRPTPP
jgi:hypothetical protein